MLIARIKLNLKQNELASKLGISQNYLCQTENGKATNLSLRLIKKIADELSYTVQEVF